MRVERPWVCLAALTVIVLIAVSMPVMAGHVATSSEHTTDTDFNNAQVLDNLDVVGSGDSAELQLRPPDNTGSVSRDPDDTTSFDSKAGLRIQTGDSEITSLEAYYSSNTADACKDRTEATIEDTSGTTLYTADSGDTSSVQFNSISLSANTEYRVVFNCINEQLGQDSSTNFPYTSDKLDIIGGTHENNDESSNAYAWSDLDYEYAVTTEDGQYISATHDAENVQEGFVNLQLDSTTATIEWQAHNGSSWTAVGTTTTSSSGEATTSLSGDHDQWRVNVTFEPTGDGTADLTSEGVRSSSSPPQVDNSSADPSGGKVINEDPVTLSIDIADPDFATAQGDEVTLEWYVEGSKVDTTTHTQNETASTDVSVDLVGENKWHVNATDEQGHTVQSDTFKFETPSQLTVRREDNASQIVTGTNITVTFYSDDGTTIVQRSDGDGDGNISLSGLPNTDFVVTIDADGYYDRRAFIGGIFEQTNIYVLNSTDHPNAIDTTFVYEDRTGNFPPDDTSLRIQRGVDVNNNGTHEWETVAGDFWGAAGEFPFTGEDQARYRLVIQNDDGTRRVLGTHIPSSDGTKNIIVGKIEWGATNGTGRFFDATLDDDANTIGFLYQDPEEKTNDIRVQVWESGNKSNVIHDQNYTSGPYGTLEIEIGVTDAQSEETWIVSYSATHDDDGEISGKQPVGGSPFLLPIDPWLLGTLSFVMITFIATLYGPRTAQLGAWSLVGITGLMMLFQWVDIPVAGFVVAVAVAAGGTYYREAIP